MSPRMHNFYFEKVPEKVSKHFYISELEADLFYNVPQLN